MFWPCKRHGDNEADDQQSRRGVQRLLLVEFGEDKTADNTRRAPCGQQKAIDPADIGRAKGVAEKAGMTAKPPPRHARR